MGDREIQPWRDRFPRLGWTKKSAAPLNFERLLKEQRVALYRSATLARTALRGPLCEKPLRVYIPQPLLPKLREGELEAPLSKHYRALIPRPLLPKLGEGELEAPRSTWERGWGEG